MYNEKLMDWDDDIISYAGISREQLPNVVSTTYKSQLTGDEASRLGLVKGLPVVIGATDGVLVNVGICYSMNAVMAALRDFGEVKDIRVSGSFTKSELWLQILSDVLNEKLQPEFAEIAAYQNEL